MLPFQAAADTVVGPDSLKLAIAPLFAAWPLLATVCQRLQLHRQSWVAVPESLHVTSGFGERLLHVTRVKDALVLVEQGVKVVGWVMITRCSTVSAATRAVRHVRLFESRRPGPDLALVLF